MIEAIKVLDTVAQFKKGLLLYHRRGPFTEAKGCIVSKLHGLSPQQRQTSGIDIN